MVWNKVFVNLSLFFFMSACGLSQSLAQNSIDSLLSRVNDICLNNGIPGLMISIVRSDTIIYSGGLGSADLDNPEPVDNEHFFRLGSISKSITALGFVKLADESKVDLRATLSSIDTESTVKNKWKKEQEITLEQILEHTAGFDDMHSHANYPKDDIEAMNSSSMVNAHRQSLYSRWKPGERMAYSNPGYVLAGHLLEILTKKPYDLFLKEEILFPLNMTESGFYLRQPAKVKMATGHERIGGKINPIKFRSVQGGAASDFCSNAKDMSQFLMFMLSQNTHPSKESLFEKNWFDRIENPRTTLAAKNGFTGGYGLGSMNLWANNYIFHGHDGGIDGFSSLFLYSREANLGFAISMNINGNVWSIADEILLHFLGPNTYRQNKIDAISHDIVSKYSGFYNFKSPRNQSKYFLQKLMTGHSIEFENNSLIVKDFSGVIRDTLYHGGNNVFYRRNEGLPFVMLLENEESTPVLWLAGEYAEKGNKLLRLTKNYALLASLILIVVQFMTASIILLVRAFQKNFKVNKIIQLQWYASIFLISSLVAFFITTELYEKPESINFGSVAVFISTIAFFILSVFSFIKSFKIPKIKTHLKWYYRLCACALLTLAVWLLLNGLIGIRLWTY